MLPDPRNQSVSIIASSSKRDITVSPLLYTDFSWKKAFRYSSFYNPAVSSAVRQKEQKPNRRCESKSRPGGQTQRYGSNKSDGVRN